MLFDLFVKNLHHSTYFGRFDWGFRPVVGDIIPVRQPNGEYENRIVMRCLWQPETFGHQNLTGRILEVYCE